MTEMVKNLPTTDLGSFPGSGRCSRKVNGIPLQYPCLENSMNREDPGAVQSIESKRVGHV